MPRHPASPLSHLLQRNINWYQADVRYLHAHLGYRGHIPLVGT